VYGGKAIILSSILLFLCVRPVNAAARAETGNAVVLSFAGDCTLGIDGRYGYTNSFHDVFEKEQKRYAYFFENVAAIFSKGDFTAVNLEGPLTSSIIMQDKEFAFKGPPEYANILQDGGVGAVNLSNNHSGDYLERGLADTKTALAGAGIGYFGAGSGYTVNIKGVLIGFLGYTGWSSGSAVKNTISNDISEMKSNGADIVAVSFHWGNEQEHYPTATQTDLGRFAIDAGADLVFGHHPHVIQGIEAYDGRFIVYSMGNFCYGGHKNPADKDTFIFQQTFTLANGDGKPYISETSAVVYPCLISSVKNRNDFKPTPAEGADFERIVSRLTEYSEPLGGLSDNISFYGY